MRAFITLFIASGKEFIRDRMALFWTMAFPIVFIIMFGYLFSSGGDVSYRLGIVSADTGPVGQQLVSVLGAVPVFEVTEGDLDSELAALREGDRRAVLFIPDGLTQAIGNGQPIPVSVYYDPSSQTTSQIVLTIIQQVLDEFDRRLSNSPRLLTLAPQTIQGEQMRNIDYLLPGILAMALMQLGIFATSQPLVSMREQKILRRLGATPLPRPTLLASIVLMRLVVALVQAAIIIGIGMILFNVQVTGSWLTLIGFVVLGALAFISLGYLVAAFAKTQESGAALAQLVQFPMLFLGGIFFPTEILPDFLRPIVAALPITYLGDALRQVMVGGTAMQPQAINAAVLAGWLLVCGILGARFFRWE